MKKKLLYFAILVASLNCYAQITFEKGYFITNSGEKHDCLIKNIDWKNTPTEFTYKLQSSSIVKAKNIEAIKEFGIYNVSKYIKSEVQIDRSSNNINKLSNVRKAILKTETILLKILIEGEANLYSYYEGNLRRFFYSINKGKIKQLIHKRYKANGSKLSENTRFKQQILNNVKCIKTSLKQIERLKYTTNSLSGYFIKYNECKNPKFKNFNQISAQRKTFQLTLKVGLNNTSLNIKNSVSNNRNVDFGNKNGITFGIENEYILPFNKNKWSFFIEPTYQAFKHKKKTENTSISGGYLISKIDYKSIQLPIGIKHYFFLNNDSKIYVNGGYVIDFNFNSSLEFNRNDGSILNSLDIGKTNSSIIFGLGYQYKKYSIELKYNNRDILSEYLAWNSDYKSFSLNLGYTIF